MPGFDGKGPRGDGPLTGRRMGRCDPSGNGNESMETNPPLGLGRGGRPRGCGRGFGGGRIRAMRRTPSEVEE